MNTRAGLNKHHQCLQKIRTFFDQQGLIEVQTPMLLNYPAPDAYIDSIAAVVNQQIDSKKTQYLHTSPELAMKQLLAHGSGDIYQICPVFRDNEQGQRNFNEFTLLEYYRLGFDIHALMDDIAQLLKILGIKHKVKKISYVQAFFEYANIDILNTDFDALKAVAIKLGLSVDFKWIEDLQILLFTHLIEPKLKSLPLCFIYDYPATQSALAKVTGAVAHRFELYMSGVEVANGYDELQDAKAYRLCFTNEINKRSALGKKSLCVDEDFLLNLSSPVPQCSGVAIGLDRLLENL